MKILIVSDSHGNNEALDTLITKHKDVSLFLHGGDSETHPYEIYPFRSVRGNCDHFYDIEETFILPSPFGNILLKHKPDATPSFLKNNGIKIYVHGHTHVKDCYKKNDIVYICPGSISDPRDDGICSYIILDNNEKEMFCTFYNLDTDEEIRKYRVYVKEGTVK